MNIQLASDLHLEFYAEETYTSEFFETLIKPQENVHLLILAGDIGYPEDSITKLFLAWCCEVWPHVVWVMGNHEYYTRRTPKVYTMAEKEQRAEDYMVIHPNLSVLIDSVDDTFDHLGIRILGTTMWTDVGAYQNNLLRKLNDFKMIRVDTTQPLQVADWQRLHQASRTFLQEQLDECEQQGLQAIVITHYLPSYKMILEQYQGLDINCGFAAHADDLLNHSATTLWVCGHSHGQQTIMIRKQNGQTVPCVLNARGYPNEDSISSYNSKKVISVNTKTA
jgi:metallophosphoesterase superfamily enzyme